MGAVKLSATPISDKEFSDILSTYFSLVQDNIKALAVGVSGGPDSMALAWLLSRWASKIKGLQIHILNVDHGLRPESAREARQTGAIVKGWLQVKYRILRWKKTGKPLTRLQEEARNARYALMAGYCTRKKIRHLFLAHHMDDQAETFLFRLAKGSGLDGLSAMKPMQQHESGVFLLRPFLSISKARLLATCEANGIPYVADPYNDSRIFARARLRQSRKVLEREGLNAKRLALTAARLNRAREALDELAEKAFIEALLKRDAEHIIFCRKIIRSYPDDIGLRVLMKAMRILNPMPSYNPRMEKIEDLFTAIISDEEIFRKRTLGGIIFERDDKKGHIMLLQEKPLN